MSSSTLPLITIGITCYNAHDSIYRAVKSALTQTWGNCDIVVTDDCSTDNSWNVLQELKQEYPRIRLLRMEKNGGVGAARKRIVEEALGEFIAFFDDDDESVPERLERQFQRILDYEVANPKATVFCYSNRNVVRLAGSKATSRRLGIGRTAPEPSGSIVADFVLGLLKDDGYHCWGMLGSCTMMARKVAFQDFGGFDSQFRRCAELDFAIRAALAGAHFISVDAPLITQYLIETPDKVGDTDLRYNLLLLKKHKSYLTSRRAYAGSIAKLRGSWNLAKRNRVRGRLWQVLALLLFPLHISRAWLL